MKANRDGRKWRVRAKGGGEQGRCRPGLRVIGHFDAMSVFGNLVAEEIEYGAVFSSVQEAQWMERAARLRAAPL